MPIYSEVFLLKVTLIMRILLIYQSSMAEQFVNITKVPMNILRGKYRDAETENSNIVFSFFKKKIRKNKAGIMLTGPVNMQFLGHNTYVLLHQSF